MRTPLRLLILLWYVSVAVPGQAQSLRERADSAGFLIGTAARPSQFGEKAYSATLGREFNMIEPEDAMKWWVLRPNAARFDFTPGDQVVGFAETHGMKVRGHALVWGWTNPAWLTSGNFSPTQLAELLHEHITTVVTHYRGKVFAWDVVNEAFDEHGKVKPSIWYDQPGIGLAGRSTAYIEQAFRWAHAADPEALLFYNDAEGETLNAKSDAIYSMVQDFKRRGVPLTALGCRCTSLICGPIWMGLKRTSQDSPPSMSRYKSPRWTSRCRSTAKAGLFRVISQSRRRFTGES